jgi:hypothetical protein
MPITPSHPAPPEEGACTTVWMPLAALLSGALALCLMSVAGAALDPDHAEAGITSFNAWYAAHAWHLALHKPPLGVAMAALMVFMPVLVRAWSRWRGQHGSLLPWAAWATSTLCTVLLIAAPGTTPSLAMLCWAAAGAVCLKAS